MSKHEVKSVADRKAQAADERLAVALDRQVREHEEAAEVARADRRAVWLRLHQEHGLRYHDLVALTKYGTTTIHTELRRAREEDGPSSRLT